MPFTKDRIFTPNADPGGVGAQTTLQAATLPLQRKQELIQSIKDFFVAQDLKRQKRKSEATGGAAGGAGAGAIAAIALAPFTAGASLAFLPAATAAGAEIGKAVKPAGGPAGAAKDAQRAGFIQMASPFVAGAAGGIGAGIQNASANSAAAAQGLQTVPQSFGGAFSTGFGDTLGAIDAVGGLGAAPIAGLLGSLGSGPGKGDEVLPNKGSGKATPGADKDKPAAGLVPNAAGSGPSLEEIIAEMLATFREGGAGSVAPNRASTGNLGYGGVRKTGSPIGLLDMRPEVLQR